MDRRTKTNLLTGRRHVHTFSKAPAGEKHRNPGTEHLRHKAELLTNQWKKKVSNGRLPPEDGLVQLLRPVGGAHDQNPVISSSLHLEQEFTVSLLAFPPVSGLEENATLHPVKLQQELRLEASAGVVLTLPAFTQQTVHLV